MSVQTLVETDGAQVQIETTADVIKPFFAYAKTLVSEVKVHIDESGMWYETVDPANVASMEMHLPADVFETYETDESVVGINTKRMMKALRAGRKRNEDTISLSINDMRLSATVEREYDGTEMDLQNNFQTIDPDAIRQEPDLPDLEFDATATLNRKMFADAMDAVDEVADHMGIGNEGTDLLIGGESDVSSARARIRDVVNGDNVESLFSMDYIYKMVKALKTVGVDEFQIELDEEYPLQVTWETELNGETVEGKYFQAPRIEA